MDSGAYYYGKLNWGCDESSSEDVSASQVSTARTDNETDLLLRIVIVYQIIIVRAIFIKPLKLTSKASPTEDVLYVAVLAMCYSENCQQV